MQQIISRCVAEYVGTKTNWYLAPNRMYQGNPQFVVGQRFQRGQSTAGYFYSISIAFHHFMLMVYSLIASDAEIVVRANLAVESKEKRVLQ